MTGVQTCALPIFEEVYQSGPDYFFQTSRQGLQTVNLSQAFKNLQGLWGVRAPTGDRATVSSLLTPNSRLLLLLIAPFTDSGSVSRDTYLGHLLTLYREAIGQAHEIIKKDLHLDPFKLKMKF